MLGDVGGHELAHRQRQDAGNVGCDIALPDHHRPLRREIECAVAIVGMPIVPADEFGRGVASGKLFAWNAEAAIGARPIGEDDRVIAGAQVLHRDVLADCYIADEPEAWRARDLVVDRDDLLDLGMIGCDAAPHEAERCGKPVEHVDFAVRQTLEQRLGRIEAARAASDDRELELRCGCGLDHLAVAAGSVSSRAPPAGLRRSAADSASRRSRAAGSPSRH